MKLLFDANISRRIVPLLGDLFPESSHISLVGLAGETPDKTIWEFAKREGFVIVTADADFLELAGLHGAPPKIIRLEQMDYTTQVAAALILRNRHHIRVRTRSTASSRPAQSLVPGSDAGPFVGPA